ncbi:alpha/beta hydrolase family protein [Thalassoroseus pseudoceratinae]|uniref:alpha/beta hydrolase family protein n=1 Tax=Thalassoroseus pseudoceratinae TaxID=2713176 RepID=UPI00141E85DE|nr:hypothetical protein [Thalassoroseus pseudoceratinae]
MTKTFVLTVIVLALSYAAPVVAQSPPYDVVPEVKPPYYRVRYEASTVEGKLDIAVKYTVWIPENVKTLRGVIVHQHGCGEGSCKSGQTGAYDLHWQALAAKHNCALLSPSYEQPQDADCQRWCDPRKGSDAAFQQSLVDLGKMSGHPELSTVPWALWGHSGGATWAGIMTILHPNRVAAAWLRSGAPLVEPRPDRPSAKIVEIPEESLEVPIMMNLGTKEGVTVKEGRFTGVWPIVLQFFRPLRENGCLIGISVDPLTSHECGNQRYLAIPWFDECLQRRLPNASGEPLRPMPKQTAWLAEVEQNDAVPMEKFTGDKLKAIWLPSERIAKAWMQYVKNTQVADTTPPPAPTNIRVESGVLKWDAKADLESGIHRFIILRQGQQIATLPSDPKNRFGRPLFQGLQYSDTPLQPLAKMQYSVDLSKSLDAKDYQVVTENTAGLKSN